jgi:hypothetical protein
MVTLTGIYIFHLLGFIIGPYEGQFTATTNGYVTVQKAHIRLGSMNCLSNFKTATKQESTIWCPSQLLTTPKRNAYTFIYYHKENKF